MKTGYLLATDSIDMDTTAKPLAVFCCDKHQLSLELIAKLIAESLKYRGVTEIEGDYVEGLVKTLYEHGFVETTSARFELTPVPYTGERPYRGKPTLVVETNQKSSLVVPAVTEWRGWVRGSKEYGFTLEIEQWDYIELWNGGLELVKRRAVQNKEEFQNYSPAQRALKRAMEFERDMHAQWWEQQENIWSEE